jgi:hypothetical protein
MLTLKIGDVIKCGKTNTKGGSGQYVIPKGEICIVDYVSSNNLWFSAKPVGDVNSISGSFIFTEYEYKLYFDCFQTEEESKPKCICGLGSPEAYGHYRYCEREMKALSA